MSQNMRDQQGVRQENSGPAQGGRSERRRMEGFEGMNYEQIRQPYRPRNTENRKGEDMRNADQGKS